MNLKLIDETAKVRVTVLRLPEEVVAGPAEALRCHRHSAVLSDLRSVGVDRPGGGAVSVGLENIC